MYPSCTCICFKFCLLGLAIDNSGLYLRHLHLNSDLSVTITYWEIARLYHRDQEPACLLLVSNHSLQLHPPS